jgi:hypothetical protein
MDAKRKVLVLAAMAGIHAGVAACGARSAAPELPSRATSGDGDGGAMVGASRNDAHHHACGGHDGGGCGAPDDRSTR